jgi:hypothetical protein
VPWPWRESVAAHRVPIGDGYTRGGFDMPTITTTWTHPLDYVHRRRWTRDYGRVVYIDGPDGLPIGFRYEDGDAAA